MGPTSTKDLNQRESFSDVEELFEKQKNIFFETLQDQTDSSIKGSVLKYLDKHARFLDFHSNVDSIIIVSFKFKKYVFAVTSFAWSKIRLYEVNNNKLYYCQQISIVSDQIKEKINNFIRHMKGELRIKVSYGRRPLGNIINLGILHHAAILLESEYQTIVVDFTEKGLIRSNAESISNFSWKYEGHYQISVDQVLRKIQDSSHQFVEKYHLLSNNCQDFSKSVLSSINSYKVKNS